MALNYNSRYPTQTEVDLVYYPYGKAKNVSSDDAEDGFPFERDYINDQFGFFQKILKESGTNPNGVVDTAASSQYYNALTSIITNTTYADTENLVAGITTRVDNLDGELSDAQLELTSTVDELGVVSSRAYLGVSDTVDGKADVTGIVFDSQTNGIRFRGDIFELTTSSDSKALSYNATSDEWVFSGKLVVGGDYEINSEADIRGLDGRDGQSLAAIVDWKFLNSNDGWVSYALTETNTTSYLNIVSTNAAAYMSKDELAIEGAAANIISLRIRNNLETADIRMEAFYSTNTHNYNEGFKKTLPSVNLRSGVWETVNFDMRDLTEGGGDWLDNTITGIRLDLIDSVGQDIDIDNIGVGYYGAAEKGVTYTWIKYADDDQGAGLSNSPVGKDYIGLAYNRDFPQESDNPNDYIFSLIKGTDGVDGETGYTWIAYSNFEDGTDLYQLPNDDTLYIGIAVNKTTPTESNVKTDYTWSKFKGDEGVAGQDGTDGEVGAGFYGSTYASISWATVATNIRFDDLVGRGPVNGDIFTQTRTDGTDSQSRTYNGSSWVAPELLVNGSLIATGTIAGNRFIAGTEISAPLVTGGTLRGGKVELLGSDFMKVQSAEPFGPNDLIEWYGSKLGNISGNTPLYNNLTKTNAITYLGDDGSAYFGGTIIAGTLTTSTQNPSTAQSVTVDTGTFGSNGGQIVIACGVTSTGTTGVVSGVCTSKPSPTVVLSLYAVNSSGAESLVESRTFTGSYECSTETTGNIIEGYNIGDSFTYFDNSSSTANRRFTLKANFSNTFSTSTQRVSIVTQEA